jgi:regulator of protease activity HflC (stomatin/prohibitin superfamily)
MDMLLESAGTVGILIVLFLLVMLIFIVAATSIRIVSPYQKGVVERLGRYHHTAQPGLNFVMPFIDTMRKVDMREQVVDVQPQEVITKDNVVVTVDAIVYYEATDPVKLTYNVADFYSASTKLAQTNLRNVIGETELDEALTSREMINAKLRTVLDDATDKWGVRVVRVEIKRIDPPVDVTAAMHRQMKAEREKRANILEAEGFRQSRILNAEGEAEAVKRVADAQRYKVEVEAAGQANAINIVYTSILNANPDNRVIALQYLDALKQMSNGQAAKVFIPYEATAILGALGGIQEVLRGGTGDGLGGDSAPGGAPGGGQPSAPRPAPSSPSLSVSPTMPSINPPPPVLPAGTAGM